MPSIIERRLAVIFSADAVGYSRLMSVNEVAAHHTMKSHRILMGSLVQQHGGRVVDAVGDNLMAEFHSIVDTVSCALEVQSKLAAENRELGPDRRLDVRIGVNIGEVIVDGERLVGDGVNVAARLESHAEPGGICLSGAAYEQVRGKIKLDCKDLGELPLKNSRPVRAYHVNVSSGAPDCYAADPGAHWSVPGFSRRPAVAVLPFEGPPDPDILADGIAEALIGRLATWRSIPVIDYNSSFAYRGASVGMKQVSRELGARYVVAGSLRRSGETFRVAVRLIDASEAHQIWAENYTCESKDVFELQDDITEAIIGVLEPALLRAEYSRAVRKNPRNLDAWECTIRCLWHLYQATREDTNRARVLAQRACELDVHFSPAWSLLAVTHVYDVLHQWSASPAPSLTAASDAAERGVALDESDPNAHAALGCVLALSREHLRAGGSLQRSLDLNPSLAVAHFGLGIVAQLQAQIDVAIGRFNAAMRLSPRDPLLYLFRRQLAQSHFVADRFDDAVHWARQSLELRADAETLRILAASYGQLGDEARARTALDRMTKLQPEFSLNVLKASISPALAERYAEGWRKAGWEC